MANYSANGEMRECPVCGRTYLKYASDDWAYKRTLYIGNKGKGSRTKRLIFCSYHCMRDFDKKQEEELGGRKRRRNAQP